MEDTSPLAEKKDGGPPLIKKAKSLLRPLLQGTHSSVKRVLSFLKGRLLQTTTNFRMEH
uniref:Uncharacterized protein n=1 Tax=Picea glauca TaxID=3330 RepID=A0A101M4A7_PICGL|nr:hypothetical protein ABT39_MTgene584 [Picea glauca]